MQKRLDGDNEATETFERVVNHLQGNKVDLASAQLVGGAHLKLDGRKEVFVGELAGEANPYLTREYRKPFVVPAAKDV